MRTIEIDPHREYPRVRSGLIPIDTTYRRGYGDRVFTPGRRRHFMRIGNVMPMTTKRRAGDPEDPKKRINHIAHAVEHRAHFLGHIAYKVALDKANQMHNQLMNFGMEAEAQQLQRIKSAVIETRLKDYYDQATDLNRYVSESDEELWVGIASNLRVHTLGRLAGFNVVQREEGEQQEYAPGVLLFDAAGGLGSLSPQTRTNGLYHEVEPLN